MSWVNPEIWGINRSRAIERARLARSARHVFVPIDDLCRLPCRECVKTEVRASFFDRKCKLHRVTTRWMYNGRSPDALASCARSRAYLGLEKSSSRGVSAAIQLAVANAYREVRTRLRVNGIATRRYLNSLSGEHNNHPCATLLLFPRNLSI